MLIPQGSQGRVIFERTKVKSIDFDTLLAQQFVSTIKKSEKQSGYISFEYEDRTDVLIIFENQIRDALRIFRDNVRLTLTTDEVVSHAKQNLDGFVYSYKMPLNFLEMLWNSCTVKPRHENLSTRFIVWERYLEALQQQTFNGYLEMISHDLLVYLVLQNGEIIEEFLDDAPDMSKPLSFCLYDPPTPYFVSEVDAIRLNFIDIFKDMLMTTYSLIVQLENAPEVLSTTLDLARQKYPLLLKKVRTTKVGALTFETIIKNLDEMPASDARESFLDCLIEVLHQRLILIKEHFGQEYLDRTLIELKLVQIYNQKALQQFTVGEYLFTLWKRFE
ncbi:hypothetical protein ACFL27_11175 [candidate division CSSED10-310 bacterium]|uniref:Uncharacterized protein n=1 Tax=candidate division CSSED10-310 bacterium TaxID=2855610 RepID=A0ABV6YX22_UNCC1